MSEGGPPIIRKTKVVKTATSTGRRTAYEARIDGYATGGVLLFVDPNRPQEYRLDAAKVITPTEGRLRLSWTEPKTVPYRFFDEYGVPDPHPLGTMVNYDNLVRRLSPAEYEVIRKSVFEQLFTSGIRVRRDTGCWIPLDSVIHNKRYQDVFKAVYGLEPIREKGVEPNYHNLREDPYQDLISEDKYLKPGVPPQEQKFWYTSYVTSTSGENCALIAEMSHLCHDSFCMRPDHICLELKIINETRKTCLGPAAGGICSCMKKFGDNAAPEAFTADGLKAMSCIRRPDLAPPREPATLRDGSRVYPDDPNVFLPGPFEASIPEEEVKKRMAEIARTLRDTGHTYRSVPYVFLDVRSLDRECEKLTRARDAEIVGPPPAVPDEVRRATSRWTTNVNRARDTVFATAFARAYRRLSNAYETLLNRVGLSGNEGPVAEDDDPRAARVSVSDDEAAEAAEGPSARTPLTGILPPLLAAVSEGTE